MRHASARTRLVAVATLAAGALWTGATPASGDLEGDLHSLEHQQAHGTVASPDGVLEKGCQRHGYRYRVRAGDSDWSLELFLVDPDGKRTANGYEWKGRDPARGAGHFEFCGQSTEGGRFTVKSRLTWDDGEYHEKWLKPRTIRLHR